MTETMTHWTPAPPRPLSGWTADEEQRAARAIEIFIRDRDRPCAVRRLYGRTASFEWRKLITQVRTGSGAAVLICEVPDRRALKACARDLREFLALRGQRLVRVPTTSLVDVRELPALLSRMRRFPDPASPFCQNREAGALWVPCPAPARAAGRREWLGVWQKALQEINRQVAGLMQRMTVPLLIMGPPRIQFLLRKEAPELWARRSVLVRLEENLDDPPPLRGIEQQFWDRGLYRVPEALELEAAIRAARLARAALHGAALPDREARSAAVIDPARQLRHLRAMVELAGAMLRRDRVIDAEDLAERGWLGLHALETYTPRGLMHDHEAEFRRVDALVRRTLGSVHLYRRDVDTALHHALSSMGLLSHGGYEVVWPVVQQCVLCLAYRANTVPSATRFLKERGQELFALLSSEKAPARPYEVMRQVQHYADRLRARLN